MSPDPKADAVHTRQRDIEDSANSCIGVVDRESDDTHWIRVDLTETDWPDQNRWTDQYTYQACFNGLYRKAVADYNMTLDRKAVILFAQTFITRRVQKH